MFEKALPSVIPSAHSAFAQDVSNRDQFSDRSSDMSVPVEAAPLRKIEWSELTARLSAAREIRQLLREDMGRKLGAEKLGFAQAAAQFFRANEEDERCVNHNALEARKASAVSSQIVESDRLGEGLPAEEICSDISHAARSLLSNTREKE